MELRLNIIRIVDKFFIVDTPVKIRIVVLSPAPFTFLRILSAKSIEIKQFLGI